MYSDCDLNEGSDEENYSTTKKKIHVGFQHNEKRNYSRRNSPQGKLSFGADDSLDRGDDSMCTEDKGQIVFGAGFSDGRSPVSFYSKH